jgi:chromosome segregation ATPase
MEKVLSWLNDFKSFFSSEVAKISAAQSQLDATKAELSTAKQEILSLTTAKTDLETAAYKHAETVTAKDNEITELKSKLTAAENKATEAIAGQSLPADQLPPGSTDTTSMNIDQKIKAIREKLAKSEDPKEKFILSQEIRSLLEKAKN